eukprot:8677747-Pyramimonas_sp.AAC.1
MHGRKQWCQSEGSVYVNALWIHAATMREIWDKPQAREQVLDGRGSGIARSGCTSRQRPSRQRF